MRFGVILDCETLHGQTHYQRHQDLLKEAVVAEEAGFDFLGLSQQHFLMDWSPVSAPEVIFGALSQITSRIHLRHTIEELLNYNHPIRTAERLATEDILLHGRLEVGTGRGNNLHILEGFGVDPSETRAQWRENFEVIVRAMSEDPFSFEGEYWSIPPRSITPKCVQDPHPPFFLGSQGLDTHQLAGQLGIGCMSTAHWRGWDAGEQCVAAYREAVRDAKPLTGVIHESIGPVFLGAHCAPTLEQAVDEAYRTTISFIDGLVDLFFKLGQAADASGAKYSHGEEAEVVMRDLQEFEKRGRDLAWLAGRASYLALGTPDTLIEKFKRVEAMGYDEVLLRLDGMEPEVNRRSIEDFGRYVIPEFKCPSRIVRGRGAGYDELHEGVRADLERATQRKGGAK